MNPTPVTIQFHEDTLTVIERDDGQVFVAIKPICETLGLDWSAQLHRIKANEVLAEGMVTMTIPSQGGPQETICLSRRRLGGWLFGLRPGYCKPELRPKVIQYQREVCDLIDDTFFAPKKKGESRALVVNRTEAMRQVRLVLRMSGPKAALQLYIELGLETVEAMFEPPRQRELKLVSSR
jgi:hypothetical protein